MKLLIIEDNQDILENVFEYFELKGHVLDAAQDGVNGLRLAVSNNYDAIVLDIMLPGIDGIEICKRIRKDASLDMPILMLTAKDSLGDKLEGFSTGVDDYLIKPFALPELEARLEAIIRRRKGTVVSDLLRVGDLTLDPKTLEVRRQGRTIELSRITRKLLLILMRESPSLVLRTRIEEEIWGMDVPDNDVLRSHIYQLRNAIDRPFDKQLLQTVPKEGYRLVDINEQA
jgi:DNA-binding response OmpR family regulator